MSSADFLLRNVLTADHVQVDIEVIAGTISRVGSDLTSALPVVEGHANLVLPGLVDLHTHLR